MRVTFRVTTQRSEISANLIRAIVGNGEQLGYMFTDKFDPAIRQMGDEILAMAKTTLAGAGGQKDVTKTLKGTHWKSPAIQQNTEPVEIGRSTVVEGAITRTGLLVSDWWDAPRFEWGTAPSKSGRNPGYPATHFMGGSAFAVAARHGAKFEPINANFIATNPARKKAKA